MNKVFVVVEIYTFEFATDYRISIYSDKESSGNNADKTGRDSNGVAKRCDT